MAVSSVFILQMLHEKCATGRSQSVLKMPKTRAPGWLSQLSIRLSILAGVVTSRSVERSPPSGSALTVQTLLEILSLPLSLPLSNSCALCLSQNK